MPKLINNINSLFPLLNPGRGFKGGVNIKINVDLIFIYVII